MLPLYPHRPFNYTQARRRVSHVYIVYAYMYKNREYMAILHPPRAKLLPPEAMNFTVNVLVEGCEFVDILIMQLFFFSNSCESGEDFLRFNTYSLYSHIGATLETEPLCDPGTKKILILVDAYLLFINMCLVSQQSIQ